MHLRGCFVFNIHWIMMFIKLHFSHLAPDLWPVCYLPQLLGLVLPGQTQSHGEHLTNPPGHCWSHWPSFRLFHHSRSHALHNWNLDKPWKWPFSQIKYPTQRAIHWPMIIPGQCMCRWSSTPDCWSTVEKRFPGEGETWIKNQSKVTAGALVSLSESRREAAATREGGWCARSYSPVGDQG